VNIYPVDSEHSAIFQCLAGEWHNPIEKIVLTASGGPFRGSTANELATVTKAQALKHPNWDMGAKITIDSASLMNKGLEAIEAKWLFNLKREQIEIIVHPQSIIHSIVQFRDGSMKAQMGLPDMKLPIQYAMAYPDRLPTSWPRFDFLRTTRWGRPLTFEQPDLETFRNLALALDAMDRGGNAPCVLNAANEVAVELFLQDAHRLPGDERPGREHTPEHRTLRTQPQRFLTWRPAMPKRVAWPGPAFLPHGDPDQSRQLILSLSILVVLHELGHFLPARWFGTAWRSSTSSSTPGSPCGRRTGRRHRVRYGLVAVRRLREDQRHGGREHGQGAAGQAARALGIPQQTRVAAPDHHGGRRYGEPVAWAWPSTSASSSPGAGTTCP
jgi:hypothetical protein